MSDVRHGVCLMGLTRSSSGLLLYDTFASDTESSYTETGGQSAKWSVGSGLMSFAGDADSFLRRADLSTVKCATVRCKETSVYDYTRFLGICGSGAGYDIYPQGYFLENNESDTNVLLGRCTTSLSLLASVNTSSRSGGTYYVWRLYTNGSTVYAKQGATALANLGSASDSTYSAGHVFFGAYGAAAWDWLHACTAHTVSCTGMTDGHYLRVSDGTTAAEAAASGGTATVDAGLVLFPFSTVQIRTASGGGGDLIAELDTGDYADMCGGDVYAYSADATALPFFADLCGGLNNPFSGGM